MELEDPAFLASPIDTLVSTLQDEETQITFHDIVEAYNLLYLRLRLHAPQNIDVASAALAYLETHAESVVTCLRRDLRRGKNFRPESFSEESLTHPIFGEPDIEESRLVSSLCQHALRLASLLFALPGIYDSFSTPELAKLFRQVVLMGQEVHLPIVNAHKAYALVFWSIQSQRLPSRVLLPRISQIVTSIEYAIIQEGCGEAAKLSAFKAIHTIVGRYPEVLEQFTNLLPSVLNDLTSETIECRLHAAFALSGFTAAKLAPFTSSATQRQLSSMVHEYLNSQGKRSSNPSSSFDHNTQPLSTVLQESLQNLTSQLPYWSITVISSLVVVAGGTLFSHPRSLKIIFNTLRFCIQHPDPAISFFHAEVWKACVWALSQSCEGHPQPKVDTFNRAFKLLAQETKQGIVSCLSIAALGARVDDPSFRSLNVQNAIAVIRQLVANSTLASRRQRQLVLECILLLDRLVSAIGASTPLALGSIPVVSPEEYFPRYIVDGSLLTSPPVDEDRQGDKNGVTINGVHYQNNTPFLVARIPPLSEDEIVSHWDELADAWASAAHHIVMAGATPEPGIMDTLSGIWQALLLSQSHLTQGRSQLTTTSTLAEKLASFVTQIVAPPAPQVQEQIQSQICRLLLSKKLWKVFTNVFSTALLPLPAEIILGSILKVPFDLGEGEVRNLWSELCAELIQTAPTLLQVIRQREGTEFCASRDKEMEVDVTRHLWLVHGRHISRSPGLQHPWTDLFTFLVIPFGTSPTAIPPMSAPSKTPIGWNLNGEEQEIWKTVFGFMIENAKEAGVQEDEVLAHFFVNLSDGQQQLLLHSSSSLLCLLQRIPTVSMKPSDATTPSATQRHLEWWDAILVKCYSRSTKHVALEALTNLFGPEGALDHQPPPLPSVLTDTISKLQQSLTIWLEDKECILDANEYQHLVKTLYFPILDAISKLPASHLTLELHEDVLTSVFHTTTPILDTTGPDAFYAFWRKTYHHQDEIKKSLPTKIWGILLSAGDVYNDSVADGISLGALSPSTIISDSQSSPAGPRPPPYRSSDPTGLSQFSDLAAQVGYGFQVAGGARMRSKTESGGTPNSLQTATPRQPHRRSTTPDLSTPSRVTRQVPPTHSPVHALHALHEYASSADLSTASRPEPFGNDSWLSVRKRLFEDRQHSPSSGGWGAGSSKIPVEGVESPERPRKKRRPTIESKNSSHKVVPEVLSEGEQQSIDSSREIEMEMEIPIPMFDLPPSSDDDYDSWEAELLVEELKEFQRGVSTAELGREEDGGEGNSLGAQPKLGLDEDGFPHRSRPRNRSQTAPALDGIHQLGPESLMEGQQGPSGGHVNIPQAVPLRRHYSSSAQLDALQDAYAIVVNTDGVSQIPVEELAQARRILTQISGVLDEQMYHKMGKKEREGYEV